MTLTTLGRSFATKLTLIWIACVAGGILFPHNIAVFDLLERWLDDLRVAGLSEKMDLRDDIVVITITEETISQFPYRSPIDRRMFANVLTHLNGAGVRAVGIDILFDQATEPDKDRRLAEVVAAFDAPLIVGWADSGDGLSPKQIRFLSRYLPNTPKAFAIVLKDERDGIIRRFFPGRETENGFRPSLAAAVARAVGVSPPTEQVRLVYRRGPDNSVVPFPTFPAHLVPRLPKRWFAGKIVLIGADLPNDDRHRTPFATLLGNKKGTLPGVMIHAHSLAQILDGVQVKELVLALEVALLVVAVVLGGGMVLLETTVLIKLALGVVSLISLWASGYAFYAYGGLLIPLFSLSVVMAVSSGITILMVAQNLKWQKEKAERLVSARSESLAAMSHEIRTPINGIQGIADVLSRTKLTDEQGDYVETIVQSCDVLLVIVNDILDFSKLESGKFEIENLDFKLPRTVRQSLSLLRPRANEKGIELVANYSDGFPEWVKADSGRLRQILLNLVGNAIKFTETGSVVVSASHTMGEDEKLELRFEVRDSGIGISPEAQKKLFSPFVQADNTVTRKYGGTGLGLAISKRFVELMGGEIGVESVLGKGSTFWFTMCCQTGVPVEAADAELAAGSSAESSALKILVAEDNAVNQKLIKALLGNSKHSVEIVDNGLEAVEAVKESRYDVVLMDSYMPEMDGITAAKAIRALGGERAKIPIIIVTANAIEGDREKYLAAGMDDYVSKPVDRNDLFDAITRQCKIDPDPGRSTAEA